ncbi:hypothetical protein [Mucilaginibacter celer]|uniref:Transcription regulator BetR N-terminal domain-containing protein n=1 Tax=Mucilaginibacter celer TaxID=2305508 RepID=A0A494VYJ8_9SPHI|nr:hypothetical protein [Mucilaginibacter celer]AYL99201.1 hypothetical protein HYN43_029760 [Mucilaginibacter celer]
MDSQTILLNQVKARMQSKSLLTELAGVLNISYDAAHRRITGKTKLLLEEAIIICQHYSLSPDQLFMPGNRVLAEKTKEIRSAGDFVDYLKQSIGILNTLKNDGAAKIYYSAKDIPLFYTIDDSLLSKFKQYVWLGLLSGNVASVSFEQFDVQGPIHEYGKALRDMYSHFEAHEIWNDTTVNSGLQQIYYYYRAGLLNIENALTLLNELETVLKLIEDKSAVNNGSYHLYYNELLVLNNNVLVVSAKQKALFVPYNLLGYFITYDDATCANTELFFNQQLKHSMPLNTGSLRDRKQFFNRAFQRINIYRQRIEGDVGLF